MEAVKVLARCEHRLGHPIPEEDLISGNLKKWLSLEDYNFTMDQVSDTLFYRLLPWCTPSVRQVTPLLGQRPPGGHCIHCYDFHPLFFVAHGDQTSEYRGHSESIRNSNG